MLNILLGVLVVLYIVCMAVLSIASFDTLCDHDDNDSNKGE